MRISDYPTAAEACGNQFVHGVGRSPELSLSQLNHGGSLSNARDAPEFKPTPEWFTRDDKTCKC